MRKFIIFLIFALFISAPVFVSAEIAPTKAQLTQQLIQTLTKLVAQLEQKIAYLKAQNSNNATTPIPAPVADTSLKGNLYLSQNPSYQSQTFTAPRTGLKLADFYLTNNTNEPVNLNKIEADLAVGTDLYSANIYVSNLYAIYDNNKTSVLSTVSHNNYFQITYLLPAGHTIGLSVYGDVNSSIPLNSNISAGVLATGISTDTSAVVNTNSNAVLAGPNMVFGAESLTVGQDSSTPVTGIYSANQRIVAGKFKIASVGDSYNISELEFTVPGSNNALSAISDAVLADTQTKAVIATVPGKNNYYGGRNNSTFDFNVDIPIDANSAKYLTVYYDLGASGSSGMSNIAPVLIYVKAQDSKGTLFDGASANYKDIAVASYKGIVLPNAGVTVNGAYAYKSIPVFMAGQPDVSAPSNSDINLCKFTVGADINGDVSIKQLEFQVKITDPNKSNARLNSFKFFKNGEDYTNSAAIGSVANSNYMGLINNGEIGDGTNTVIVNFDKEETIPAGKTQTYMLKAFVSGFANTVALGADYVSTYIPSDSNPASNGSYLSMVYSSIYSGLSRSPSANSTGSYNLLWSDKSSANHSDSSSYSSGDWYDGFGISGLPLLPQAVVAK